MPSVGSNAGMLPMAAQDNPRSAMALAPLHPDRDLLVTTIEKILKALGDALDTPLYHDVISENLRAED
eukprot:10399986-Lingulodinium_polyedra.AAC.1